MSRKLLHTRFTFSGYPLKDFQTLFRCASDAIRHFWHFKDHVLDAFIVTKFNTAAFHIQHQRSHRVGRVARDVTADDHVQPVRFSAERFAR